MLLLRRSPSRGSENIMLRLLLFLSLLILPTHPLWAATPPATGMLRVNISGIRPLAGGQLRVALFRGARGWPKLTRALRLQTLPVAAEQTEVAFPGLPPADNYAVEVHHDENGNGKVDMRWFPYPRPKEGVGVSNNRIGFGPPDFTDARFRLDGAEKTIEIRMHY